MSLKSYLIVIDTAEGINLRRVARGMLNVHVILAESESLAREQFLKVFNPQVAAEIQNNLYVYDIVDVVLNLEKVDIKTTLPLFSHLPLSGGRPPKQNNQFAPTGQPVNPQQPFINNIPKLPQAPVVASEAKFTKEQAALIASLGAVSADKLPDYNNPKIGAATGYQTAPAEPQVEKSISDVQKDLLQKFNVLNHPEGSVQSNSPSRVAMDDLDSITTEAPLSEDEINKYKQEIGE